MSLDVLEGGRKEGGEMEKLGSRASTDRCLFFLFLSSFLFSFWATRELL